MRRETGGHISKRQKISCITFGNLFGQYSFFHQSCATGTLLLQKEIYPQKSLPNLRQLIFCRLLKKVFFALPWVENVEVFQDSRTTDSTHFLYRQRLGSASSGPPSIYLSECEALSRYCCHGLFHSLPLNNRTSGLTLFCMPSRTEDKP